MNCVRPMLGYAHTSRQAYSQANALALSRLVTSEFAVSLAPLNKDINGIKFLVTWSLHAWLDHLQPFRISRRCYLLSVHP
ncbi:hypothetical protein [Phaffia rhodozyma]|uniref:Uncharacterized protein n=1 Tax=Phaffia rhodozyma TaxID=264483 RepID=A0A0F7SIV0_PHARH|nr:hypothetical protein [Phaffia rhodozyma]